MRPKLLAAAACRARPLRLLRRRHAPDQLLTLTAAETRPGRPAAQRRPERGDHRRRADRAAGAAHDPHPGLCQRDHRPVSEGRGLGGESRRPVRPAARRDDRGAHRPGGARSQPVQPRSRHPAHRPAAQASASIPPRCRWWSSTTRRSRAAPRAASPPTASKRGCRSPRPRPQRSRRRSTRPPTRSPTRSPPGSAAEAVPLLACSRLQPPDRVASRPPRRWPAGRRRGRKPAP